MFYNTIGNYLNRPYDFLKDHRVKLLFSIVLPVFIFFFLWFLGPFGLALFPDFLKIKLFSLFCLFSSIIIVIYFYVIQKVLVKTFTIGTTILWLIWIHLTIGLSNCIIYFLVTAKNKFTGLIVFDANTFWMYLPRMLLQTFLVGLLPTLFIIMRYNFFYLKKKITVINQINYNLTKSAGSTSTSNNLSISSSTLGEVITIEANSMIYISSKDNYVEIHWLENGFEKHALLRNTLSNIEKEISTQNSSIKRCHRGYIINMNRIKTFTGNEAGYKILLECIDFPIPVSRKYKKSILQYLKQ